MIIVIMPVPLMIIPMYVAMIGVAMSLHAGVDHHSVRNPVSMRPLMSIVIIVNARVIMAVHIDIRVVVVIARRLDDRVARGFRANNIAVKSASTEQHQTRDGKRRQMKFHGGHHNPFRPKQRSRLPA